MKEAKTTIFLCYAREDKNQVVEIYNRLKMEDFDPWIDIKNLRPGQNWENAIVKAIKKSDFILIFFSEISVSKRGFVQKEFNLALKTLEEIPEDQTFIIPLRLVDCKIPGKFSHLHYCDLFEKDGIDKLIDALKDACEVLNEGKASRESSNSGTLFDNSKIFQVLDYKTLAPPFVKIKFRKCLDQRVQVQAFLKGEMKSGNMKIGMAIDGSRSMIPIYGDRDKFFSTSLGESQENKIAAFAKSYCPELTKLDIDNEIALIYWATGLRGEGIEYIGTLNYSQASNARLYEGPSDWGTGTRILPAIRYFVEDAFPTKAGFYIFISDGVIEDEEQVTKYCLKLANSIYRGLRPKVRFFLIGIGARIDLEQLHRLDDMSEIVPRFPFVDLWDTEVASRMEDLDTLFREIVAYDLVEYTYHGMGRIKDHYGNIAIHFSKIPKFMDFYLPEDAIGNYFILETEGNVVQQPLLINRPK